MEAIDFQPDLSGTRLGIGGGTKDYSPPTTDGWRERDTRPEKVQLKPSGDIKGDSGSIY